MKTYLYLSLILSSLVFISCENIWDRCADGNGNRTSDTRTLASFEQIQVNGDFQVEIDTGSDSFVKIEADENLLDLIVTHVSGNKLIIESRNGDCLRPTHSIEINVITPHVSLIDLNGSGYVYLYGMETDELELRLAGSGQIECNDLVASAVACDLEGSGLINSTLVTENLTAQLKGSGEIRLSGASANSDLKVIGSGRIKADQINTDVCYVYISGSGIVDVNVNNALDVSIIGSGIVYYEGNPTVESFISGSGKVIKQ
jgi:hypothetical protein